MAGLNWFDFLAAVENVADSLKKHSPESTPDQSKEMQELREEYGYKLLAKDAEIEALQQERDELRALVRAQNEKLQGAHDAWERLHVALYGADG